MEAGVANMAGLLAISYRLKGCSWPYSKGIIKSLDLDMEGTGSIRKARAHFELRNTGSFNLSIHSSRSISSDLFNGAEARKANKKLL